MRMNLVSCRLVLTFNCGLLSLEGDESLRRSQEYQPVIQLSYIYLLQYRTFDGSCNNEDNPEWGKANTPYRRIAQRKHTLVHCGNPSFLDLPNARLASRVMVKRAITDEPDASNDTTVMLMTFGQVVDHDMQLTPLRDTESGQFMDCCAPANKDHVDCCPIEVPEGDLFFGIENRPNCLPFLRSKLFEHQG